MDSDRMVLVTGLLLSLAVIPRAPAQQPGSSAGAPLPDIRQLMHEVQAHQRQLDQVRENYTYSSLQTTQDIDQNGKVTKTETMEGEDFFVNGHVIERTVKKNGQPLAGHDLDKETERVTKLVEKAGQTPPGQPLQGQSISISRVLEIMDVRNPRRELFRGRPTIVFDFVGRKDAKTHGMVEDASKKLQGTLWIDEADRQVAHMEVSFNDNFRIGGGLVANIQKGSSFRFDQAAMSHPYDKVPSSGTPVGEGLWLPTGAEGLMQARLLMVKNLRQRFTERDFDYKRFRVEAEQTKDARVVTGKAQ